MRTIILPLIEKLSATKTKKSILNATGPIKNALQRSPDADCFVVKNKAEKQTQKIAHTQLPKIKNNDGLRKYLEELKTKNGKPRLKMPEINYIVLFADTPEKARLAGFIAQLQNRKGHAKFDVYDIKEIVESANTPEKTRLAALLANLQNKKGNAKFDFYEIKYMVKLAETPEKAQFVGKLAQLEDKSGDAILDSDNISRIITSADTPEKLQFKLNLTQKLAQLKDKKGNPRLGRYDIVGIVKTADTPKEARLKFNLTQKLAQLKDKNGNNIFISDNIVAIVQPIYTPEKAQLAEKLAQLKDKKGNARLGAFAIREIVTSTDTPEQARFKLNLTRKLANIKNKNGGARLDGHNIRAIVSIANTPEKALFAERLAQLNDEYGHARLDFEDIEKMVTSIDTPEQAQFKFDLTQKLAQLKDKLDNPRISHNDISSIVISANTPEKAQLAEKLAQLEDKNGNTRLDISNIRLILLSTDTPEKAQIKFDLTRKLAKIKNKNGKARLTSDDLTRIVTSADTPKEAQLVSKNAYNKDFLSKIDALDTAIGNKLYAETLKSEMSVDNIDVQRMNKLYNYLCENKINLQQYGEEKITNQSIMYLLDHSMLKAASLLDDGTIKYATKLKYSRFKEFIYYSSNFANNWYKDTFSKLQSNLSKLSTPGLKFERLQSIIALRNADSGRATINEAINLIKSTRTTVEEINMANKIFTTDKPYQEQIQAFFEEFNVADDKKESLKKFFEEQKLILAPKTQNSIENQLMILDKKIQDVRGNAQIPESKKSAYVEQLEKQKAELIAKPQSATTKLSDKALTLLAQQIEHHINIPKDNAEFNNFIHSQIYKQLDIEATPELLKTLNFNKQYLTNLFTGLSDDDFSEQFTKLIKLVNENPKPLSELRETLEHNKRTKKLFEQNGINYQKWIKFDKNSQLPFSCETNLQEAIRGVELNILNELNGDLFKSVEKINKVQTDKIMQALVNAGYKVDTESITKVVNGDGQEITQKDLEKIVDIFKDTINKNAEFWDKPLYDTNSESLKNELIDHLLKGRKKEVSDLATMANVKMDLAVRLSDDDDISRNLFLGNHVGCCTSVGGSNGFAAPQHLMNTFVRGMEIVDKNGNSYGNSMCYFAKIDNKLSFVIDSFEANGKLGGNQAVTDAIVEYAKQVTKEMGKPDIPIYFGPNYNKINLEKFGGKSKHSIEIVGNVDDETYIDAIGGCKGIQNKYLNMDLFSTRIC